MRLMLDFMKTILLMPKPWVAWVALLFTANGAAVLFLPRFEAAVVLAGLIIGAIAQMGIFNSKGFVRLLGIGHFHWIPMVIWLMTRFDVPRPQGVFELWLVVVIAMDILSLVIDMINVGRYLLGDREVQLSLPA